MKQFFSVILVLWSVCAFGQIEKVIPKKPVPPKLVNDFTNTLTVEQVETLERKLVSYDDSTSSQVAIVIIPTLNDYPIEDVALRILRDWGVGGGEKSNGIVLLVAKDDRKVRIEVGYGLEGAIPDVIASHIIQNSITPAFRAGNYYRGLDAATDDIFKAAAGEYKASAKKNPGKVVGGIIMFIIIIIFIIIGSAAGGGRGGGGMMSRRGYGDVGTGWLIGTLLGNLSRGGGSGGGWSGGGGGWSGGGGGFGGFGGGSGGGGGASGSW